MRALVLWALHLVLLCVAHAATPLTRFFLENVNASTLFKHEYKFVRNDGIPAGTGVHLARAFVVASWWAPSRAGLAETLCKHFRDCVVMPGIYGKELTVPVLDMLVENGVMRGEGWLYSKSDKRAKLGTIGNALTHLLILHLWTRDQLPGGSIAPKGCVAVIEDDLQITVPSMQTLTDANLAALPTFDMFQMFNKDCGCGIRGYLKQISGASKELYKVSTRWKVGKCTVFARRLALTAGVAYSSEGAAWIVNQFPFDDLIDSFLAGLLRGYGRGLRAFTSCMPVTEVQGGASVRQMVDNDP